MVHTPIAPVLLCYLYRPPDAGDEPIAEFKRMCTDHSKGHIGTIAVGDMNVHHQRWLGHSSQGTTAAGNFMKDVSEDLGWCNASGHQLGT